MIKIFAQNIYQGKPSFKKKIFMRKFHKAVTLFYGFMKV